MDKHQRNYDLANNLKPSLSPKKGLLKKVVRMITILTYKLLSGVDNIYVVVERGGKQYNVHADAGIHNCITREYYSSFRHWSQK